jgi:hypothetical protein
MGWDFSMGAAVAADGGLVSLEGYEANYTFNVSPMFYAALTEVEGGIRGLNGKTGEVAGLLLERAIERMRAEPERYRAMNPVNGWGNYDGAVDLLVTLASWCHECPAAVFIVS